MSERLSGKVALITAAAQGIGRSAATLFASEGASVSVTDINEDMGRTVVEEITRAGGRATFKKLDVVDEQAWADAVREVVAEFGGLHILVNNAGIAQPAPLTELSYESWKLQLAVNLDSTFLGLKYGIPAIAESGGGSIVNLSSEGGTNPWMTQSAMCASKAAVKMLTKVAALECAYGRNGVRVNTIDPGVVQTPAWEKLSLITEGETKDGPQPNAAEEFSKSVVPVGYHAVPDDVAEAMMFLVTSGSHYMTGAELLFDGGLAIAPAAGVHRT